MDENKFIENYLKPSADGLDRSYTLPLPPIEGLKPCGEFIVQGRLENTVSTNIVTKYESPGRNLRLVEVYKNTQEQTRGIFIRLVGTLSLVIKGYPFVFLDAAISNVSPQTGQQEALTTKVAVHLPQAQADTRSVFFDHLSRQAAAAGLDGGTVQVPVLPEFWGALWHVHAPGVVLETIEKVRQLTWEAYDRVCTQTDPNADFDYRPVQEQMVFKNSAIEYQLFQRMGLSVASEAQAAFFSILSFTE